MSVKEFCRPVFRMLRQADWAQISLHILCLFQLLHLSVPRQYHITPFTLLCWILFPSQGVFFSFCLFLMQSLLNLWLHFSHIFLRSKSHDFCTGYAIKNVLYISMDCAAQKGTISLKGGAGATWTFALLDVPWKNAFWINHQSMLSSFMWEIFPTAYNLFSPECTWKSKLLFYVTD